MVEVEDPVEPLMEPDLEEDESLEPLMDVVVVVEDPVEPATDPLTEEEASL